MTAVARWLALLADEPALAPAPMLEHFGDVLGEAALVDRGATMTPMPDLAVIRLGGSDAIDFAQAQFSGDCGALRPGDGLLTAWCTPKGRVLYLPRLLRSADGLYILVPQVEAAEFYQRLRKFVFRARVDIEDLSESHGVLVHNRAATIATGAKPPSTAVAGVVAAGGAAQRWYIGEFPALEAQWRALAVPAVGTAAATLADLRLGTPRLAPGLGDEYLPQELNLDLSAGVSFDKGCYPGQEIIARVRYRGTVKRRLQRFVADATVVPPPATRLLLAADDATGDGGRVLYGARATATTIELLAVTRVGATAPWLPPGVALRAAPLPAD